jgi:multiple sugar transport system substrate-binding protein
VAALTFLGPDTDAYVASVARHLPEFTRLTGHSARMRIVPSDHYFSNEIHDLLTGDDAADVYMSGPVLVWEHLAAGLVQPLDEFVASAGDGYDPGDFLDAVLGANRWTGRFGDPLGAGPLLEIPVNCESYNLAYVPAVLERHGLEVPATWGDFFAAADGITRASDGSIRGFGQRGTSAWHTMYTGYASQFWSYGAADFDEAGRCAIASEAGVAATQDFVRGLRASGPSDWPEQRWYELALDFANGGYGLLVDSDHYVAFFEDEERSSLAGRIGYAPPPAGPTGLRTPNLWTWSVVMNPRSRDRRAAWELIEWATGPEFLRRSAFEGNMNPTRASTWDDPAFVALSERWGAFYEVARALAEESARVLVTPMARYRDLAARWTRALHEAYTGADTVRAALEDAARDIDELAAATA